MCIFKTTWHFNGHLQKTSINQTSIKRVKRARVSPKGVRDAERERDLSEWPWN
jgi:hypothetical protein